MKVLSNPRPADWPELVRRPTLELEFLESAVRNIINLVRVSGDSALLDLTLRHDGVKLRQLQVTDREIAEGCSKVAAPVKKAIEVAAENIRKFHANQVQKDRLMETMPGVKCWRKSVPIQKVGIYIPGGTAPLFSTVLMLGLPAQIAGCSEVILCTPPAKDGGISPEILFAASLSGIKTMFKVGGAQAIAAMAYGTESIPSVHKIFGPGNQYVTKAKQMVNQDGIAIDMPAGPSEVLVMADETSDASYLAADMLSQAEHGIDSQAVLVSVCESKVDEVNRELSRQLPMLPRKEIAGQALQHSMAIHFKDMETAIQFVNAYAAEHLIINTSDCDSVAEKVINAGSVFLGSFSPEAVGDYASGTNHTLPTNGFARAYSGVSMESFMKVITFQKLTAAGLSIIGPYVEIMAAAEQLEGHRQAVSIRLKNLK